MKNRFAAFAVTSLGLAMLGTPAFAGSHTWDVSEIFSSADGTVQFIELTECCGGPGEVNVGGHQVTSGSSSFIIPSNVAAPTSNRSILFATQAFADLPGAPTPDHIIVENFFSIAADTISYTPWDTFAFGAGQLPTDGVNSLFDGGSTGVNSPTNYAGETGSVVVPPDCPWDFDAGGSVNISDLLTLLGNWGNPWGIVDLLALLADWGPC